MKFELIRENIENEETIETIFKNRGIKDVKKYLSLSVEDTIHWSKLNNIEKARDVLLSHIKKNNNIFVQVDSDADGYTSAALLINYINKLTDSNCNIIWDIHNGKEHGIKLSNIPDNCQLVIVPDAGSNNYKEHKVLNEKCIDVIVLDHHECEKESEYAIIVNSQLSEQYSNKQLSGVGIVYKFCQSLDNKCNTSLSDEYLDLVAVGNIADSQDMRSEETRYYVNEGLSKIKNKLLQALYEKQSYSTKGDVNIITTSFYINPLINACIRTGTQEQKKQLMRALLESDEKIYYKRNDEYEDIFTNTARMLSNAKAKQTRERDKGVKLIEEKIEEKRLLDNKLLIVNTTDLLDPNLSGLVANILSEKYQRGTLLMRYWKDTNSFTGSIRGFDSGEIKDLKSFLQKLNLFDYIEGHANAAGFKISSKNLIKANSKINTLLKDVSNERIHYVDFIIKAKSLDKNMILEIDKLKDVWGYKVNEPLIAVKDVRINKNEIQLIGKYKNTIKFTYKNIDYIKFFTNEDEYNSLMEQGEVLVFNIVGKCKSNTYNGTTTPQIAIEDYEVTKTEEMELVF